MDEIKISVVIFDVGVSGMLELSRVAVEAALAGMDAEIFEASSDEERISRMKEAQGEYILLLNSGVVIGEDILRTLCFFMDEHKDIGAVGVKMIDARGCFISESRRMKPTAWSSFCDKIGLSSSFSKSKWFNAHRYPLLSSNKKCNVEVLPEACMMIRRKVLAESGFPEDNKSKYDAGTLLSMQILSAGYKNYYLPERVLSFAHHIKEKGKNMHKRLLIQTREESFEKIKALCVKRISSFEYVNLWDLDVSRVMDSICRSNQMKGFTDMVFCYPDVRFEQMALLMDKMPNKKTVYHIYIKKGDLLVSSKEN